MKRILLPVALAGAAGLCSAQSSVTLYGIVDAGFSHGSGSLISTNRITSGNDAGSRLGFKGTEDLGGGHYANYQLEAGINLDTGAGVATNTNNQASGSAGGGGLAFNRRSTVSLIGPWGELRAGRDLAAHYLTKQFADPFNNVGVGTAQPLAGSVAGPSGVRVSNMIGYYLAPKKNGFYTTVQYFLGENSQNGSATEDDGTGAGMRLGYVAGPLDIVGATGRTSYAATATTGTVRTANIAAKYAVAAGLDLSAGYYVDRVAAVVPFTARGYILSARYSKGGHVFRGALSRYGTDVGIDPTSQKLALGYVYGFSKRTSAYATYARLRNSGGASAGLNLATTGSNQSSSGFDLGIRHNF